MKAHLIDSPDPLREGERLTAICGKEILRPQFVFWFDTDTHDFQESLNTLLICRECCQLEIEERYVYGVTEAEG